MVDLEVPSRAHPATFAAPVLVVLSKINIVLIIGCQGAINELLLREANRRFISLLSNCALEGGGCTESPTRAAVSLILDCMHEAILKMIHVRGSLNARSLPSSRSRVVAFASALSVSRPRRSRYSERVIVEVLLCLRRSAKGSSLASAFLFCLVIASSFVWKIYYLS